MLETTSIPVPTILDVLEDRKKNVLFLMTSVPGLPLGDVGNLKDASPYQLSIFSEIGLSNCAPYHPLQEMLYLGYRDHSSATASI